MDFGHWTSPVAEPPADAYGFIYKITNNISGLAYIGKKQMFTNAKLKPLKGQKRHRRRIKETDWKKYVSSSKEVAANIESLGKENFSFEIIRFCNSKWELSYFETKTQFDLEVLLRPNEYLNGIVHCRINRPPKGSSLHSHSLIMPPRTA